MAAEEQIPIYTTLTDLYQNLGTSLNHAVQWDYLVQEFIQRFERKPEYIARAPGRVNLIGEHIDYALFGVLPIAIERDILIACARRPPPVVGENEALDSPGSIIADNLSPQYSRQVFAPKMEAPGWHLDIDTKQLRWESYVKAGYYGVLDHYFPCTAPNTISSSPTLPASVDLLVTGTVPPGSGLSSSAAMVVASTLAMLAINGKLENQQSGITKGELARITIENEKRVGVNSGGMDQAASVMSLPASALFVSFYPKLNTQPVPLPPGAVFVCANSLVVSDKVVHAPTRYNLRVVETLVGARVLARKLGIQLEEEGKGREKVTLREVVGRWVGEGPEGLNEEALKVALEKVAREVDALSKEDVDIGVTMEEMILLSGLKEEEFRDLYFSWVDVDAERFQLYKRVKHVLLEALRVLQFREICLQSTASSLAANDRALRNLGRLMNESQESCSHLFECSCPEIDELTQLAREAGAYGSRLTGAGWGGCTISLLVESNVDQFIAKIRDSYAPYMGIEDERLHEVIFVTKPSSGACVYKFD